MKETTQSFFKEGSVLDKEVTTKNLDYPFDYSYDYLNSLHERRINNTGFVGSEFEIVIYGAVTNPIIIYIGGHAYEVCCEISNNEYLTINSRTKTIVLTRYNGEKVNCFCMI